MGRRAAAVYRVAHQYSAAQGPQSSAKRTSKPELFLFNALVAGTPGYWSGEGEAQAGGLYLFRPAVGGGDGWAQAGLLTLGDMGQNVYLGKQVALDGETVAGGAPLVEGSRGAVYLFPIPGAP